MSLKTLREAVCGQDLRGIPVDIQFLVRDLTRAIDQHRPLGSDGTHGDLHTSTCGCEDKP